MDFFNIIILNSLTLLSTGQNSTSTSNFNMGKPIDISVFTEAIIIGIILLAILASSKKLRNIHNKYNSEKEKKEYKETLYDNLDFDELDKKAEKLNHIYQILVIIYAVLLTFIITEKISLALTNWYFVIWCGWVLALLVRIGTTMFTLFDLSKKNSITKNRHNVFAAREFFRHALFLLIPSVAFLPTFFFQPVPTEQTLHNFPWDDGTSFFSAGIAIAALFFVFYQVPLKIQDFAKKDSGKSMWVVVILLIVSGVFVAASNTSPLQPIPVTLFNSTQVYIIPAIFVAITDAGFIFFLKMIQIYWRLIPEKYRP